jgi:hypothetical protein
MPDESVTTAQNKQIELDDENPTIVAVYRPAT